MTRAVCLAACLLLTAGRSSAQTPTAGPPSGAGEAESNGPDSSAREEAAQRFQRGLAFYQDGDHSLALIEFDRAYQLVPDYRVLYNIGQVSIQLSRFARARLALEQYLAEGGSGISAERIQEVERDLRMLEDRTAHLEVRTTPEGVEVFVDDRSQGVTPLEAPLLVDAGEHQVVFRKKGFQTVTRRIVLAGAERLPLSADLVADSGPVVIVQKPEPEVKTAPPAEDEGKEKGVRPATIAWIGTGVLGAAALTTGILGLDAKGRYDREMSAPDPDEDAIDAAAAEVRTFFLATDILLVGTAAALGTSLYLTLHKPKSKAPAATVGRPSPVSVDLVLLPSTVRLRGTF